MKPCSPLAIAAVASLAVTPALAQPAVPAQPKVGEMHQGIGGVNPVLGAADSYAGAPKDHFYSVEARIADLEARAKGLRGPRARSARSQIIAIKAFEATQRSRHGGELRDWDRETLTARLNKLEAMIGG